MDKLEQYLNTHAVSTELSESPLRREVAYQRIKDAIQYADLTPGEPLSELKLSKLLGISRTPVREALQQLAQEGLVQIIPGQAITVASRSIDDVLNAVHMRTLLEPALARLVAEQAVGEHLETLRESVDQMDEALAQEDYEAWLRANTLYHEVMSAACPNELLGETVLRMCNRVHHLANIDSQTNPVRLMACTNEHRRIVQAILDRDGDEAEQAMIDHLKELRTSLFNRLSFGQL